MLHVGLPAAPNSGAEPCSTVTRSSLPSTVQMARWCFPTNLWTERKGSLCSGCEKCEQSNAGQPLPKTKCSKGKQSWWSNFTPAEFNTVSTRSGNYRSAFFAVYPRGTFGTLVGNFPFKGDRVSLSALSSNRAVTQLQFAH